MLYLAKKLISSIKLCCIITILQGSLLIQNSLSQDQEKLNSKQENQENQKPNINLTINISQLCSKEKLSEIKESLPQIISEDLNKILNDQNTLFYTKQEIPPAYQFAETGTITGGKLGTNPTAVFFDTRWNISGDAREASKGHNKGGNGNIEFPWRTEGGLDFAENYTTSVKFMNTDSKPIIWFYTTAFSPNQSSGGRITGGLRQNVIKWIYPVGTTFGEILYQKTNDNQYIVFEIRTRTKNKDHNWDIDIFRPFPNQKDLENALNMTVSSPVVANSLLDKLHPTKAGFLVEASTQELPEISPEIVTKLLQTTPFKSALGSYWSNNGENYCFAPTSSQEYNIVPKKYLGTYLGTDSESCQNCHKHTLKHVNEFHLGRDWYGYIRGSDGIFTFHPISPERVTIRGQRIQPTIRSSFVKDGLVEQYNEAKHDPNIYQETKFLNAN